MKQVCMPELQVVRTEYHHVPVSKLVQNEYFDAVYCCKYLQNGFVIVGECRKVVPADGISDRYANACETLAEHNAHEQIMLIAAFLKKTGFNDPAEESADVDEHLYHVLCKLQELGFKLDYYAELTIGGWSAPKNSWLIYTESKLNCEQFRLSAQPIPKFKGWRKVCRMLQYYGVKIDYFSTNLNDWMSDDGSDLAFDMNINQYRIQQQPITIELAKIWPELKKIGDKNVQ